LLDADCIVIRDGKIAEIGKKEDMDTKNVELEIDANGMTVTPGFIDPHLHSYIGDWSQISRCIGYMEGMLLAGTTTVMSQGDCAVAGLRVDDPISAKAVAILGRKTYDNYKPGGALKVHGGGIMLVKGFTENDFKEMHDAGCRMVAEIGGWGAYKYEDIKDQLEWAREHDMIITMHFAPTAIPGSGPLATEEALLIRPDVAVHVNMTGNGGGANLGVEGIRRVIEETDCFIEFAMVSCNYKMSVEMVKILAERDELSRLVTGSDSPIGTGLLPSAMLRAVTFISSMNGIPAEKAIACATGNNAKAYRLSTGVFEVGREADILVIDAPLGSKYDALKAMEHGDLCGTAMIMVDGKIVALRGRDTRPIEKGIKIQGVEYKPWRSAEEYLFGPYEYSFGKITQY
jgi:enamidase